MRARSLKYLLEHGLDTYDDEFRRELRELLKEDIMSFIGSEEVAENVVKRLEESDDLIKAPTMLPFIHAIINVYKKHGMRVARVLNEYFKIAFDVPLITDILETREVGE